MTELTDAGLAGRPDVVAGRPAVGIAPVLPARPPRNSPAVPIATIAIAVWLGDAAAIMAAGSVVALIDAGDRIGHLLPVITVCCTGIARVSGAYDVDSLLFFKRAWPRIANAWLGAVVGIAALVHALAMPAALPIGALALWFAAGLITLSTARIGMVRVVRRLKCAGAFDGRTAIVGTGAQAIELADYIARTDDLAVSLIGFFGDHPPCADATGALTPVDGLPLPYLGDLSALVVAIRAGGIDTVFVALPWSDQLRLQMVVDRLSSTPVEIRLAPEHAGFAYARHRVSSLGGLSIITMLEHPLTGMQQALKAIEDRVLAGVALILLAPLMLATALAIRLTSPGPVLFRQSREGFNCRPFEILKFRTMRVDAAPPAQLVQAMRCDPRVTPVGAVLRRTSIDELPQLFNVLLGHMSLVGPRPHAPATRAGGRLFADVASHYAARHNVKPGLTGWAQVCGWRGETTTEEKLIRRLEHDIYYIEHWSIWFDLYIIARTAVTVLAQRNAY